VKSRVRLTALVAATAALGLAACSGSGNDAPSTGSSQGSDQSATETYNIGITQYLAHPSLDAIVQGFKDALSEKGVETKYDEQNAQGEATNTSTIAGSFASNSNLDLVLAVATPSAQAVVQAITDRPVLFAGVTDPVSAQLVPGWEASGTNVTGTSDLNPEGKPAGLIKEALPEVKTVGFIYSLGEENSKVQLDALRAEGEAIGITVKDAGVANSSELTAAIQTLQGVDALYVGTDNTVVNALETVVDFAETNKIPLFVADAASVERGGVATRGIDYYQLGRRTGEMAYQILVEGTDPGSIPSLQVTDTQVVANPDAAKAQGLTLTEDFLKDSEIVTTAAG
jgi:putative ABC transport system substrate-binding protein